MVDFPDDFGVLALYPGLIESDSFMFLAQNSGNSGLLDAYLKLHDGDTVPLYSVYSGDNIMLKIGESIISGGTSGKLLYNYDGIVGEIPISSVGGGLTVGSSVIESGAGGILWNNGGTLGEKVANGSGDVVLESGASLYDPNIGRAEATSLTFNNVGATLHMSGNGSNIVLVADYSNIAVQGNDSSISIAGPGATGCSITCFGTGNSIVSYGIFQLNNETYTTDINHLATQNRKIWMPNTDGVLVVGAPTTNTSHLLFGTSVAGSGQFRSITSGDLPSTLGDGTSITNATLITPNLGTPSGGTLASCTGLPVSTGLAGLGTNVATALSVNQGGTQGILLLDQRLTAAQAGLTYHWDPANYSAGVWENSIGGVNFNQTTSARRPTTGNNINSLPSLTFVSASSLWIPSASNLSISSDQVFFAVWRPNHAVVGGNFAAEHGAAVATNDGIGLTSCHYGGQVRRNSQLITVSGSNKQYLEASLNLQTFIVCWEIKGGLWNQWVNGTYVVQETQTYPATTSFSPTTPTTTAALFYIGAKTAGSTAFSDGYLGEFGIYSGQMSADKRVAYQKYLANKYGVTM